MAKAVALLVACVGAVHARSAVGGGVSRVSVDAPVVGRSLLLRGGKTAAEEDGALSRLRLSMAEGVTKDVSLVEMSTKAVEQLGLETGEHVILRGRKQRKTACMVVTDAS